MIGRKIKELRILKGLTQEDLAEKTSLSVRTIQRIESGDVDPRTYTLNLLADALDVKIETFTAEKVMKDIYQEPAKDHLKLLALLHLSGLFNLIIPPLLVWIWKKGEISGKEQHYKDVMNFQLSMLVYILASLILGVIIIGLILLPLIGVFSTVIILINTSKVMNGQDYKYPLSIRFMK